MEHNPELTFACSQVRDLPLDTSPLLVACCLSCKRRRGDVTSQRCCRGTGQGVGGAGADPCAPAGPAVRVGQELLPWALCTHPGLCGQGTVHSCWRHLGGNGEWHGEPGLPHSLCHPLGPGLVLQGRAEPLLSLSGWQWSPGLGHCLYCAAQQKYNPPKSFSEKGALDSLVCSCLFPLWSPAEVLPTICQVRWVGMGALQDLSFPGAWLSSWPACAFPPGWEPAQWGVHGEAVPPGTEVLPGAVWPDVLRGTCSFPSYPPCPPSPSTPCSL